MNSNVIRLGNLSTGSSQAGTIYGSWGASPMICAGTHGYAIGYILVKKKGKEK